MIATGRQIREGRLLTGMSATALAMAAGVGVELVIRAELADCLPMLKRQDSAAIQRALEAAGVEFTVDAGDGTGVRMRKAGPAV